MSAGYPACPFCGSDRTLPFEKEEAYDKEYGPEVAIYAGLTLVTLTLGLLLISMIYFRLLLLLSALTILFYLRKKKKRRPRIHGDFVCLGCSRFFRK